MARDDQNSSGIDIYAQEYVYSSFGAYTSFDYCL